MNEKEIRQAIREIREQMKACGIRRSSFMNGGHDDQSYRLNARLFELSVLLRRAQGAA